jgi:hypothetical protein
MRGTRIISRVVLTVAALAILASVGGCKKHENFPTQLDVVEAPAPTDFTITALPFTNGTYDYDLTWSISDPTNVDRYRLYLIGAGLVPELLAEPTGNAYSFSLPFNASGLQFGLSTVSTGSVESNMTVAIVPTPE